MSVDKSLLFDCQLLSCNNGSTLNSIQIKRKYGLQQKIGRNQFYEESERSTNTAVPRDLIAISLNPGQKESDEPILNIKQLSFKSSVISLRNVTDKHDILIKQFDTEIKTLTNNGRITIFPEGSGSKKSIEYKFKVDKISHHKLQRKRERYNSYAAVLTNELKTYKISSNEIGMDLMDGRKKRRLKQLTTSSTKKRKTAHSRTYFCAIVVRNSPDIKCIMKTGNNEFSMQEQELTFAGEKLHLWRYNYSADVDVTKPKIDLGYICNSSWIKTYFSNNTFIKATKTIHEQYYYCYLDFDKQEKLIDTPNHNKTTFLPFLHWILDLNINEQDSINLTKKIYDTYVSPRVTNFPSSILFTIINHMFSSCSSNGKFKTSNTDQCVVFGTFIWFLNLLFVDYIEDYGNCVKITSSGTGAFKDLLEFIENKSDYLDNFLKNAGAKDNVCEIIKKLQLQDDSHDDINTLKESIENSMRD